MSGYIGEMRNGIGEEMNHPETEVIPVDQDLVKFSPIRAEIEGYKKVNADLVFDYATDKGEKEARSHIAKLRKVKTSLAAIHKDAKAYYLAGGRKCDKEKNELTADVEEMVDVHWKPIKAKEDAKLKIAFEKAEVYRLEQEKSEIERLRKIREKEEEIACKERAVEIAEEKVKKEAERLEYESKAQEREKQATVDAEAKAESDKAEALKQAEASTEAAVQAEKDRQAAFAEEMAAEEAMIAAQEEIRVSDEDHRKEIEGAVLDAIGDVINVAIEAGQFPEEQVLLALIDNEIPNVTINY